jgi:uncharacterized Fe-S cluster protein YjdI
MAPGPIIKGQNALVAALSCPSGGVCASGMGRLFDSSERRFVDPDMAPRHAMR